MSKNLDSRYFDLTNKTRWYVIANRVSAVMYFNGTDDKFHFIERLSNPDGNLKESELDSDKPGRGFSSAGGGVFHHALDRRSKQHKEVAKKFAKKIGNVLEQAQNEHRFGSLVLVAEPHFLGLLRESLSQSVSNIVDQEIAHEYEGSDQELRSQIFNAINKGNLE